MGRGRRRMASWPPPATARRWHLQPPAGWPRFRQGPRNPTASALRPGRSELRKPGAPGRNRTCFLAVRRPGRKAPGGLRCRVRPGQGVNVTVGGAARVQRWVSRRL